MHDRVERAARTLWQANRARARFENLADDLAPASVAEAYDMQAAYQRLAEPALGPVAGMKIATTTKVMQTLMGIDHPCGGGILARTVHASPATIRRADHTNVRAEFEVAVRLGSPLDGAADITRAAAMAAVSDIAPAFELIDDRHAVYRETRATSLIVENAWNAGVVLGAWQAFDPGAGLGDIEGIATIDGAEAGRGRPDDPFGALAWLANLARSRGRPLAAGMFVITGSLIPTLDMPAGAGFAFRLGPWGEARMRVV